MKKVLIRTTDTAVLVLAIAHFHRICASDLWIAFDSGNSYKCIAAHAIAASLVPEKVMSTPWILCVHWL